MRLGDPLLNAESKTKQMRNTEVGRSESMLTLR